MNQKGAREQNDISIIRNLPKRLQKRIVEDVGENTLVTLIEGNRNNNGGQPSTSNGGVNVYENKYVNYDKVPMRLLQKQDVSGSANQKGNETTENTRINFFLKNAPFESAINKNNNKIVTEPVLETSGKLVVNKGVNMNGGHFKDGVQNVSNGSIPGILRLNDSKQAVDVEKKNVNENNLNKNNGRRPAARNHQVIQDNLSKKSPSRQLQRQPRQPPWFEMLADIPYAESLSKHYEKITSMMHNNVVVEQWCEFSEVRQELQTIFTKLLLQQLKLCCEQKIDTFFWKLLYYNVREYFITNNNSKPNSDDIHNRLLILIDEGLEFYTDMHTKLREKYIKPYQQSLSNSSSDKSSAPRSTHKFEFIAKVAAQKLLICLGDLCRYKTKELQSNDYTDAAKYYLQAQALIPTNGIPYNQLAIISILARKKFDAVYYHMRSLMSSNAIYSARESLLVLFDEIRKKYEETELKASPLHQVSPRCNNSRSKSMRKEVWIHVDGVRRLHRTSESDSGRVKRAILKEEQSFKQLTDEELIRRFTSLYLYIIGKLFTGIGMESIVAHQRKFLAEFSVLLSRSPFPIKRSRLLKIVALNIFIMEHNMHKASRREIRYYAFNFCNQIFGLLLRKCNLLFETFEHKLLDKESESYVELSTMLQYINIYSGWLTRNIDIWEAVRNEEHIIMNSWAEWESFNETLKRLIDGKSKNISLTDSLEEEVYLLGFTPLMSSTACKNLTVESISSENEQFFARLQKIQNFQDHYEGNEANLQTHEDSFTLEELNGAMENVLSSLQSDEDDNSENIVVNGTNSERFIEDAATTNGVEDTQISQLSKRRKELEARTNVKKLYNAKLEELLKFLDTKVYIEVRPKYLMPDTNCFIDCLDDFVKLINEHKRYILIIPLTVVKELDGLYKGVKVETYQDSTQKNRIHHYDDVSTCAKRSLDFIMNAKNNVKCATTKGSFINASLFALAEEEFVSNDDKILSTALSVSKAMSTETNRDGKYFIQTELVLITTDRNLRVKALARNLAVSEMVEFLQWIKDCNT